MSQPNLKRVGIKKKNSYNTAKKWQSDVLAAKHEVKPAKVKIFARNDGTFDVVTYVKIEEKKDAAKK